jgi:hypothetical protein
MWQLYVALLATCFMICVLLILHKDYDDGIIGKFALGLIATASAIVLLEVYASGVSYEPLMVTVVFTAGVTLFLLRFLYRWQRWRLHDKKVDGIQDGFTPPPPWCEVCVTLSESLRMMFSRLCRRRKA